jgi:hypothetical protein
MQPNSRLYADDCLCFDESPGSGGLSFVTGKPLAIPAIRIADPVDTLRFMFAVGIECSCPTIVGGVRVDQLRDTGHYEMWRTDL